MNDLDLKRYPILAAAARSGRPSQADHRQRSEWYERKRAARALFAHAERRRRETEPSTG